MKNLNKDIIARDKIIFGRFKASPYKFDGIRKFSGLTVDDLQLLLDQNFADPNETHNLVPSIQEIFDFMKKYPAYTAHGYTVVDDREDYRVSIEGVEKGEPAATVEEFQDYMDLFRYCNTFDESTMFCWFD